MRTTSRLPIRLPVFLFPWHTTSQQEACSTLEQEPHCSDGFWAGGRSLIFLLTGGLCVAAYSCLQACTTLHQHEREPGARAPPLGARATPPRGAGRKNEWKRKWTHRRRGIHPVSCGATFFFCIWDVKRGTLGDSFFSLPISIWDLANNRCVCLACQPTSQQYCSLILNQHQQPATS